MYACAIKQLWRKSFIHIGHIDETLCSINIGSTAYSAFIFIKLHRWRGTTLEGLEKPAGVASLHGDKRTIFLRFFFVFVFIVFVLFFQTILVAKTSLQIHYDLNNIFPRGYSFEEISFLNAFHVFRQHLLFVCLFIFSRNCFLGNY